MKKILLALIPLLISSCAADGSFQSWQERAEQNRIEEINRLSEAAKQRDSRTNTSAEKERKDFAMCKYEALKATGSSTSGSFSTDTSSTIANDIATGVRQGEIMRACLEANGYSQR